MSLLLLLFALLSTGDAPPASAARGDLGDAVAETGATPGVMAPGSPAKEDPQRRGEFRFDALRIDGQLRGPEAMVVRSGARRSEASVLELRRTFLHRVAQSVEAPSLHGGQ